MKSLKILLFCFTSILFSSENAKQIASSQIETNIEFDETVWVEFQGKIVSNQKLVLQFERDFAPYLGQESPIQLADISTSLRNDILANVKIFKPLFKNYNRFDSMHYEYALHQYYVLEFNTPIEIENYLYELSSISNVMNVEPAYRHQAYLVPNDPTYPSQWAHDNTGQATSDFGGTVGTPDCDTDTDQAWDVTTGSEEIIIAILDTGVNSHSELAGRLIEGYDFINNDSNASDDYGHGSSCAGIAAAEGNNGSGIAGVCWECLVMPVKVLDAQGYGDDVQIADAVTWSSDNGANIISMSLGGGSYVSYFDSAINYAVSNGTTIFSASGNDNSGSVSYPSGYDGSISVGALSPCNERKNPSSCDNENYWGSNYGSNLDFLSPGVRIHTITMSGGYTSTFNGTSSACPHAAGIGGLILSIAPYLTPEQVRFIMQSNADDLGAPGFDVETGFGRINAFTSVTNLLNSPEVFIDAESLSFNMDAGEQDTETILIMNLGEADLEYSIDPFGYHAINSHSENMNYEWIDIDGIDEILTISHNDQSAPESVNFEFEFPFYDNLYSSCIVNANGWIGFGNDNDSWQNTGLPNEDAPLNAIFGFWDDLNPDNQGNNSGSGEISYHSNQERVVVWFNDVIHWVGGGSIEGTYDFQFVLYPTGSIHLNYRQMEGDVNSATIGIQNETGENAYLIAMNNEYVENQFSIDLSPRAEWLNISALSGTLSPNESEELIIEINANGLLEGDYTSEIVFSTNDFENPEVILPILLTIESSFCAGWDLGDLDQSGSYDVLDVLRIINIVLHGSDEECLLWAGDVNQDSSIDVLDVVLVVNWIMGN